MKWRRMCYRFISSVEMNDECALVSYAQPAIRCVPASLWRGEKLFYVPPPPIGWQRKMKADFLGVETRVLFTERSSWLYIDFFAEDYVSVPYVCWRAIYKCEPDMKL